MLAVSGFVPRCFDLGVNRACGNGFHRVHAKIAAQTPAKIFGQTAVAIIDEMTRARGERGQNNGCASGNGGVKFGLRGIVSRASYECESESGHHFYTNTGGKSEENWCRLILSRLIPAFGGNVGSVDSVSVPCDVLSGF